MTRSTRWSRLLRFRLGEALFEHALSGGLVRLFFIVRTGEPLALPSLLSSVIGSRSRRRDQLGRCALRNAPTSLFHTSGRSKYVE
jgi:hypothetical protein